MDFLLFPFIKILVVAVIISANMAVRCSICFQPIVVLGLHIQIHAHAVLGCTDHVRTDHPE